MKNNKVVLVTDIYGFIGVYLVEMFFLRRLKVKAVTGQNFF
jgi:hypothetical protein